jgi:hypothetical protein
MQHEPERGLGCTMHRPSFLLSLGACVSEKTLALGSSVHRGTPLPRISISFYWSSLSRSR